MIYIDGAVNNDVLDYPNGTNGGQTGVSQYLLMLLSNFK
jgi:hypothetical protein